MVLGIDVQSHLMTLTKCVKFRSGSINSIKVNTVHVYANVLTQLASATKTLTKTPTLPAIKVVISYRADTSMASVNSLLLMTSNLAVIADTEP